MSKDTILTKSDKSPLVSVLMTVYNREEYLHAAIESVLASTYENFELIIVDDCSSDESFEVALNYSKEDKRIRLYRNDKNLGDYPNRNVAASYAQGKYLKYCDSDEELYPYCLSLMVEGMEKFPLAALGLSHVHDDRRLPYEVTPTEAYKRHFLGKGFFNNAPTSTIIRRSEFEKLEGFKPIRHRGDYDLWLRLGARYNVVRLPAFLTFNFYHPNQEQNYNLLRKKVLNYQISMGALQGSMCPLSKQDSEIARCRWERGFIRNNVILGLMKLRLKETLYLIQRTNLSLAQLMGAIKPLR